MFANGWGNAVVGLHGMVNIMCNGTPKAWAQCMWAKLGGFAIISICHERLLCVRVRLNARLPAAIENLKDHFSLTPDISCENSRKFWHDTGILDHVLPKVRLTTALKRAKVSELSYQTHSHQLGRISSDGVKFQTS